MGRIEELKKWYTCRKEGRTAEYETYKVHLKTYKDDIERFKGYIVDSERKQ